LQSIHKEPSLKTINRLGKLALHQGQDQQSVLHKIELILEGLLQMCFNLALLEKSTQKVIHHDPLYIDQSSDPVQLEKGTIIVAYEKLGLFVQFLIGLLYSG